MFVYFPGGGWLVVLCNAYFDESESEARIPVMTVGGYLVEATAAERFSNRAKHDLKVLGLPFFHQTDCANRGGYYRELSLNERIDSQNRLIRNIHKRAIFGFATSINVNRYYEIVGRGPQTPTPYTCALTGCLAAVRRWAERTGYGGDIAYFFEDGCNHQADAARFMSEVMLSEESKADYHCVRWGFSNKRKEMPLAAADMIAWFTSQEFTRAQKGYTERRKDFAVLIRDVDKRIDHDDDSLRQFRETLEKHGRIPTNKR